MQRLVIALVLAVVAGGVGAYLSRRKVREPVGAASWTVPAQLDRRDFTRPDAPWLVALFSSASCEVCSSVWERTAILEGDEVAVQNLEARADRHVHERYAIDAVPLLVIADGAGVVRKHFLGPVTAADLWAALAELR